MVENRPFRDFMAYLTLALGIVIGLTAIQFRFVESRVQY